ncbi:VOC family protein [Schumannella soli]|uniref:VOC family protein n=2 Tax=Schumannella soli TaxID=2590779 RepID=A0A506Y9K1_9MICO|nr:VOC family protein [Schumannella soli]
MGAVTLDVADLDGMTAYYRDAVGLDVISAVGDRVELGRGAKVLLKLQHSPDLRHASPHEAGLFHTAFLFDSKAALAAAVYGVAQRHPDTFRGSSDHLVSNAFYFDDPEGNGVELYWDRDRSEWSWTHGRVEMTTLFLDPNRFLQQNLTEQGLAAPGEGDAEIGHVHLSVGSIGPAREFYVERLGFDTTAEIGDTALFVSAGGYHHHMAMNVWNSRGAGRRQPTLGLGQVDIVLPGADAVGELSERMRHYGIDARDDGRTVSFDDPWANTIRVLAAPETETARG